MVYGICWWVSALLLWFVVGRVMIRLRLVCCVDLVAGCGVGLVLLVVGLLWFTVFVYCLFDCFGVIEFCCFVWFVGDCGV